MPSNAYEALPRSSHDLDSDDDYKEKPRLRKRKFGCLQRRFPRFLRACKPIYFLLGTVVFLLWQLLFNASYTNPRPYRIPLQDKVFIAANIIDGDLMTGPWGDSLVDLVNLIGKDRVYVSIFGGPTHALEHLSDRLDCDKNLVSEELHPLDLSKIPRTTLPTGETKIKRIAYLAEVRNKALEPLQIIHTKFDKVLFINDVFWSVQDATRLLWGTNVDTHGKAIYKAACATDFVTSWKMYDTFATRDSEGYSIGVPIFPWFANEGDAISRKDVLAGKDAVRVKSCWGGMTAFDARYLQRDLSGFVIPAVTDEKTGITRPSYPLHFRSEPEPFWDASECCLIHADIQALPRMPDYPAPPTEWDTGIYMNPYVRVTYDATSRKHVGMVKRFERLFAIPQAIINHFAHMPVFNSRRTEVEGQVVKDRLWVSAENATEKTESKREPGSGASTRQRQAVEVQADSTNELVKRETIGMRLSLADWTSKGHYVDYERKATRGAYCDVRQLLVMKEGKLKEGEGNWDNLLYAVPPLGL